MSKECRDCYYAKPSEVMGIYYCKKKKKRIDGDNIACSSFVSDECNSCIECYYSEVDTGLFARRDSYICKRTNKKISSDDVACSHFIED